MPVVLSPSPGMNFQRRSHGKSNISQHDIQNDIILRESAFIADQLLKKLTPAKPVHHHTEVPPVRQNLPEAPTAQILSPKTSPMIQKPPPPQLSSTRARTHFNSLLVPLLKDTSHLGKRRSFRSATTDSYPTTTSSDNVEPEPAPANHPTHRSQAWPSNSPASSSRNNLYVINEENTRDASHSQQQYRQPFPQYPSQRLPPLPPSTSETKAAVEAQYKAYRNHNRQHENRNTSTRQQLQPPPPRHPTTDNAQTNPAPSTRARSNTQGLILNQRLPTTTSATGKRRPGQGISVTVPIIGPPPPGRRNRNRKGKGSAGGVSTHSNGRNRDQEGWETVNVHGVRGAGRPF